MSFAGDVKAELSGLPLQANHCRAAELTAIILFGMKEDKSDPETPRFLLKTESIALARRCARLLYAYLRITPAVSVRFNADRGNRLYRVAAEGPAAEKICSLAGKDGTVQKEMLRKACCRRAFLRGAFLAAGSVTDPNSAYHFEIAAGTETLAKEAAALIASFGIEPKVIRRKRYYIAYVKEGANISDLLGYMGANVSLLNMENVRVVREMRGRVNRNVNCETANIGKTIQASVRQTEDIRYIGATIGFSSLPKPLDDMARIRLQYPEASLIELGMLLDPPVGKSGVNHRLRKLSRIADDIRVSKEEQLL